MDYGLDKKSNTLKTFNTIFIISWLLVACFPFIWTFWGSFKVRADFFSRSDWWYAISAFNKIFAEISVDKNDLTWFLEELKLSFDSSYTIRANLGFKFLVHKEQV